MAYFCWIHSTRVNSCSEQTGVVFQGPEGQGLRPTAAAYQYVEIAKSRSPALIQDSCRLDLSLITGLLCGFQGPRGCYRYSSSKA